MTPKEALYKLFFILMVVFLPDIFFKIIYMITENKFFLGMSIGCFFEFIFLAIISKFTNLGD